MTLEFSANDDAPVNLSELRFHIPTQELAGDEDPIETFKGNNFIIRLKVVFQFKEPGHFSMLRVVIRMSSLSFSQALRSGTLPFDLHLHKTTYKFLEASPKFVICVVRIESCRLSFGRQNVGF